MIALSSPLSSHLTDVISSPIGYAPNIIWSDTFTATDGTVISAHTSDSGGAYTGTAVIMGNTLTAQVVWADTVFTPSSSKVNLSFSVVSITNKLYHYFRNPSPGNKYMLMYIGSSSQFRLFEIVGSVWTQVRSASGITLNAGDKCELNDDGAVISVRINGVEVINYPTTLFNTAADQRILMGTIGDAIDNLVLEGL